MKTVKQLLSNVFNVDIPLSIPEITDRLTSLGTLTAGANAVVKETYVAKFLMNSTAQANLAFNCLNVIDELDTFEHNYVDDPEDGYNFTLGVTAFNSLCKMMGYEWNEFPTDTNVVTTIGYFAGEPLNLCGRYTPSTSEFNMCLTCKPVDEIVTRDITLWDLSETPERLMQIHMMMDTNVDPIVPYEVYWNIQKDADGSFVCHMPIDGEDTLVTLDAMIDSASARLSSLSCLTDILKAAQIDDEIEISRIRDITNLYGDSETTYAISSLTAGMKKLNFISACTLIAKVLQLSRGELDDENGYRYTPLDTPTFVDDILSFTFSLISAAINIIAYCIGIVWGAIATIITELASMIYSTLTNISEHTESKIMRYSPMPIFNLPLGLGENSLHTTNTHLIKEMVDEYGCASALLGEGGSAFYPWYLPKDFSGANEVYHVQGLLSAQYPLTFTYRSYRAQVTGDGYFKLYSMGGRASEQTWTWETAEQVVSYDNAKLLNTALDNLMLTLNTISRIKRDDDTSWAITWPTTLKVAAKNVNDIPNLDSEQKCSVMYALLAERIKQNLQYSYDWDDLYAIITADFFKSAMSYNLSQTDFASWGHVVTANELNNPSVQWATISREAILGGLIATAAVVAVSITAGLIVKRTIRKMAVSKLSLRQDAFDKANKAYQQSKTAENKNKLYKANRKLTRAWNLAGRSGISMWNGFSTSTSSTANGCSSTGGSGSMMETLYNTILSSSSPTHSSGDSVNDQLRYIQDSLTSK